MRTSATVNGDQIICTVEDAIAVVTLNRPEAKNAITTEMWRALPAVLLSAQQDGARVAIITGAGDAFAAGADLEEISEIKTAKQAGDFWVAIESCLSEIERYSIPTMAMINGACVGGGCLLASACDLRFAAERAVFGVPVARLGIVVDDRCISRLINLVGDANARLMLFTGAQIDSAEALQLGLVNKLFSDEELSSSVRKIAAQIVRNDPYSITQLKAGLTRIADGVRKTRDEQRDEIVSSYLRTELQQRIFNMKRRVNKLDGELS